MAEKTVRESHKRKEKEVAGLADEIKKAKTLMVVNIKGLPSRQFQDIKKKVREHALIKIAKKNILTRAIKKVGKESLLPLEKDIQENCAIAISSLEGFELAGILSKNKNPVFAKAGQEAPDDIEVKEGPTNLMPGPAISELGALGIQIAVEDGKISIKQPKVVVHKGGTINASVASLLQKLDIQPFEIGITPVCFYDVSEEKIYSDIKIDSEEAVKDLRERAGKALGFAQKIAYYCKETIGYLLAKANSHGQALEKLSGDIKQTSKEVAVESSPESETQVEEVKEEGGEEKPAEEVKEESKKEAQKNKSEEKKDG